MNTTQIEVVAPTIESPAEAAKIQNETLLKTLSELELAYVGGGTGNVIF